MLESSGIGTQTVPAHGKDVAELKVACIRVTRSPSCLCVLQVLVQRHNEKLLRELKEDEMSGDLLHQAQADADLGRMTQPKPVEECDITNLLLNPRCSNPVCRSTFNALSLCQVQCPKAEV